jgi:hypothetical protein
MHGGIRKIFTKFCVHNPQEIAHMEEVGIGEG